MPTVTIKNKKTGKTLSKSASGAGGATYAYKKGEMPGAVNRKVKQVQDLAKRKKK